MTFAGKTVIVTGARSGIGFATTQRFAADGATVIMADVRDASEEAAQLAEAGNDVRFVRTDVSREAEVQALIDGVVSRNGEVDILVNNAGIVLARTVPDTTLEEWDRLLDVNLKGAFLCCRAVIPLMRQRRRGVIVNVASEQGLVGAATNAAYTATKGGIIQLTKSMAIDHGQDGIRINCVAPGPVKTPLFDTFVEGVEDPQAELRGFLDATILKRLGRPEEIANVIAFLASDESSYMTGSVVVVDGGLTAM
ncbi:MAG: SDR family oxidoreductase [Alphaproteobacteria bacterium]|nr:SDR family oxidoreductase [Alphaproteobacteria bacterium]